MTEFIESRKYNIKHINQFDYFDYSIYTLDKIYTREIYMGIYTEYYFTNDESQVSLILSDGNAYEPNFDITNYNIILR